MGDPESGWEQAGAEGKDESCSLSRQFVSHAQPSDIDIDWKSSITLSNSLKTRFYDFSVLRRSLETINTIDKSISISEG